METVISSIFDLAKKQGLSFLLLLAGFYYFYNRNQHNEAERAQNNVRVQMQIDTLNHRIDMCRNTYQMVLLNQVAENTALLKDVRELIKKDVITINKSK